MAAKSGKQTPFGLSASDNAGGERKFTAVPKSRFRQPWNMEERSNLRNHLSLLKRDTFSAMKRTTLDES